MNYFAILLLFLPSFCISTSTYAGNTISKPTSCMSTEFSADIHVLITTKTNDTNTSTAETPDKLVNKNVMLRFSQLPTVTFSQLLSTSSESNYTTKELLHPFLTDFHNRVDWLYITHHYGPVFEPETTKSSKMKITNDFCLSCFQHLIIDSGQKRTLLETGKSIEIETNDSNFMIELTLNSHQFTARIPTTKGSYSAKELLRNPLQAFCQFITTTYGGAYIEPFTP